MAEIKTKKIKEVAIKTGFQTIYLLIMIVLRSVLSVKLVKRVSE